MSGRARLPEGRARDKAIIAWIETPLSEQVDELAAMKGVSRSWLMHRALIEYIERERSN